MKLPFTIYDLRSKICKKSPAASAFKRQSSIANHKSQRGFTMVEIAISLAVIGIALVAILGVLPLGLQTQRSNREETIINQDATVLMEAIRNGSKGADDLTNYVYAITNYWAEYDNTGKIIAGNNGANNINNGYDYNNASVAGGYFATAGGLNLPINSGTNIVGLLTTPEYQDVNGVPLANLNGVGGYSNHVVAYVYSISGPATEKPPQDNSLLRNSSFTYRLICENVPVQLPLPPPASATNLTQNWEINLHELRLFFRWPQQPNGSLGNGAQDFRTLVAGELVPDSFQPNLYFFQPQSFTNAP